MSNNRGLTLVPMNRGDGFDREAFRAFLESGQLRLLMDRVGAELRRATDTCAGSDLELDIRRAQGAVRALRAVLDLPAQIYKEMADGR